MGILSAPGNLGHRMAIRRTWLALPLPEQWAGLVGEFYAPRWGAWFADVRAAMTAGRAFDQDAYDAKTQVWEEAWTRRSDEFATQPDGDAMAVSQKLLDSLFTL